MFLLFLFIFFLGLNIGSFLNVLIDRLPQGKNPFRGRSRCDHCKKTLKAADLVPVISFLVLKGRCRYCNKPLSLQYPVIELFTATMYVFLFWFLGAGLVSKGDGLPVLNALSLIRLTGPYILFSSFLVIFIADLKYQIIPDEMLLSGITGIMLFGGGTVFYFSQHALSGLLAAVVFWLIFILTKGKGMGLGDVKLAFVLGLWLGWQKTFVGIYLAFILGGMISVLLLYFGKKRFGDRIAFGPFLILGASLSFFLCTQMVLWYKGFMGI